MAGSRDHLPTESEQALGSWLVNDGLISSAQLLAAQHYGRDHKLDLRQALLKLKLVDDSKIRSTLTGHRPSEAPGGSGTLVPVAETTPATTGPRAKEAAPPAKCPPPAPTSPPTWRSASATSARN